MTGVVDPVVPSVAAYAVAAPLSHEQFVARWRSADPQVQRAWLRRAVAVRRRRRSRAATLIAARLR